MIRRFVNVVAQNYKAGLYSLHRLDVSKHLFHRSRADARVLPFLAEAQDSAAAGGEEQQMVNRLQELPAPCVKIHMPFKDEGVPNKLPFWALLSPRSSEDKVLCMSWMGDAMLCCADKQSVDPMPHLRDEVGMQPISLSVVRPPDTQDEQEAEDLYVIHKIPYPSGDPSSCFRVLRKEYDVWRWESLPPLPFVGDPPYDPSRFLYSYTVVDSGRTICLSCATPGIGTYCFDTAERQWKHAGDWILPFVGRVEYVPDLNIWLGFSPCSPYYLCATSDLDAMTMNQPPKLQYVWQDLVTPEDWSARRTQVVSLGLGRFCIAKSFEVTSRRTGKSYGEDEEWGFLEDKFIVLTGVEVGRGDDEIKVWKHKSIKYSSYYSVKGVL